MAVPRAWWPVPPVLDWGIGALGNRRINTLRKDELDQRFPGLLDMAIAEGADRATPFTGADEG